MHVSDPSIGLLLDALRSEQSERAWREFLDSYSELIYWLCKSFARDADDQSDCFLYICERLSEKNYRRLLTFEPSGRARFSTWLTVVARNLCLDWARSRFGRKQLFSSIRLLATLDREIFKCIFHRGFSLQQSWIELRTNGFDIAFHELEERTATIQKMLTSRQLWLLSTSNPVIETLDPGCEGAAPLEVRDPSPSPEDVVLLASIQKSVAKALLDLDEADRLLIRLRFYRGLSLIQVADLVGLKDAQTADRRIRDALEKLRKRIRTPEVVPGKHKSASV